MVDPNIETAVLPTQIIALFLRRLRLQLYAMPLLDLFSKYFIHKTMLFDDRESFELVGDNVEGIH